ncbi:MAG: alpha/beta hydrolase [Rhizobacter sp.]|nr:alpha/beta hydrolase [Rhizobacter sp.]
MVRSRMATQRFHSIARCAGLVCLMGAASLLAACGGGDDNDAENGITESLVPTYPDVVGEYVSIAGTPSQGTPAELATSTFLRLRAAADGASPRPANAVVLAMPGFASVSSQWLYLAAQVVSKAAKKDCPADADQPAGKCRVEVWVVQRRGALLSDMSGALQARQAKDPLKAANYYFGTGVIGTDATRPNKWPDVSPQSLVGRAGSSWKPLNQKDLNFMADWGFEQYAGDVDRMVDLVKQKTGSKNIFLAGHSQGGSFVANYAGRLRADGKRGYEVLSGLAFLDGGPSAGTVAAPSASALEGFQTRVNSLRSGTASVFTDATGTLGDLAGPAAAAFQTMVTMFYMTSPPDAESIFPLRSMGVTPYAPAGDNFLRKLRFTNLARAGMTFDTVPVPNAALQSSTLAFLGEGMGRLDFTPLAGTAGQ